MNPEKLSIERVENDPVSSREFEFVERKGLGHPDSIADGIAESVSRKLSQYYIDNFGEVLHHNTDEVQIVAGRSSPEPGGGSLDEKIYVLLTGRATRNHKGETIPVERISRQAAKEYIEENFKQLSPRHFEFESKIRETSGDLEEVFRHDTPLSNDTSFGVGHNPLSDTEKTVKTLEEKLHGEMPEIGEDIKVMGLRKGDELHLTVAAAVISSKISGLDDYLEAIEMIEDRSLTHAEKVTDLDVEVEVNAADQPQEDSIYLTVTGTSAENGDDGSVGRGNRSNGLITPHRSMSLEAASGKNPVTHVGKIYNILSRRISTRINEETEGFSEARILSRIGSPVDQPQAVDLTVEKGRRDRLREIVESELSKTGEVTERFVNGEFNTF